MLGLSQVLERERIAAAWLLDGRFLQPLEEVFELRGHYFSADGSLGGAAEARHLIGGGSVHVDD